MFGFFKVLVGMGFSPPEVKESIFPLFIKNMQTGTYHYFEGPRRYVDREKGAENAIPPSVVDDILEEPEVYKKAKLYAISELCVWRDGTLVVASPPDPNGAEVAPSEGADYASGVPAL